MLVAGYQNYGLSTGGQTEPTPFSLNLSGVLDCTDPRWATLGVVQLFSRLRWAVIIEDNYSRGEKFRNPSQLQLGWITTKTEGYVREQLQIKHLQQEFVVMSPQVYVRGSLLSYPLRLEREADGGQDIAINENLVRGCFSGDAIVAPSPALSSYQGAVHFGAGSVRQRIFRGKDTYRQNTDLYDLPNLSLTANATDFGYFDEISGLLYPGLTLGLTVEHFWPQIQSNVVAVQPPLILSGTPDVPQYAYECAAGIPQPLPVNPPCDPFQLDGNGGTTYSCGNNA